MECKRLKQVVLALIVSVALTLSLTNCGILGGGGSEDEVDPVAEATLNAWCALFFGLLGNPEFGIIGGTAGRMARTEDGGMTWAKVSTGFSGSIKDMAFQTGGVLGVAVGEMGKIAYTEDGGVTWADSAKSGDNDLNSVAWAGGNDYWAVGKLGSIYASNDNGKNWAHQDSGTTEDLNGTCFFDQNFGWAVGNNGVVTGTVDGGQNWQKWDTGVTVSLKRCFTDGLSFSLALGDNGTLIESNDGGQTFKTPTPTGTDKALSDFKLRPNVSTLGGTKFGGVGLMVGDGIILKTDNFGNNWNVAFSQAIGDFLFFLKVLTFLENGTAYTAGNDDMLLKSTDNGDNWARLSVGLSF